VRQREFITEVLQSNTRSLLNGKSTLAVSRATGLSTKSIQRYRAGVRVPRAEDILVLANYLRVEIAEFYRYEESE
jgi:transcriptional regulator with XRE-family HTH domain